MGYKPIPTIDIDKHYNNDMPTNDNLAALLNDMYTHNLTWLARSTNVYSSNMAESHIKEIQSIKLYNIDTNDITINMISTCTNAISLYCDNYDYQYGSPSEFADSFRNSPIMPRLKHLSARGILEDKCLEFCSNIYEFDAFNNPYITTCDPFARVLRILNASYECGICDIGLIRCTHIRNINVDNNPHITTCAPFAKSLRILSAQFDRCGISDQSLSLCMNLKKNVLRT